MQTRRSAKPKASAANITSIAQNIQITSSKKRKLTPDVPEIAKPTSKKPTINESNTNSSNNSDHAFWLMKAEPETRFEKGKDVKFSIRDLQEMNMSCWDGVRNYEARNNMRKMKVGDICFFYHSNCKTPGIAGTMKVCKEAYPDFTAWDPEHPYYDPKSDKDDPRWFMVDVQFDSIFDRIISLKELQQCPELEEMQLIKRGRLSIQPVTTKEFDFIKSLVE
ncbi:Thymocyte nuclear protein 1 [Physocladia obscura]|uniref:Thymocyte nuclear protein 1 n=1 Tax=Physocladia obscura TaxID=109957 RepID=A0AAD5SPB5_9FUNG|nr:Thymocyte nuclear protein 1 [Physocladia obscura]